MSTLKRNKIEFGAEIYEVFEITNLIIRKSETIYKTVIFSAQTNFNNNSNCDTPFSEMRISYV